MLANTSVSTPERPPEAVPAFAVKPSGAAATCADTGTQKRAVDRCGCGEDCSWSLAEQGGAP
jgi:hypothetical protein